MSKNEETQQSNGGFYARKPIEEIKAFKSKDGKSFVVQVIKTCVFPVNYVGTILKNESPFKTGAGEKENTISEQ